MRTRHLIAAAAVAVSLLAATPAHADVTSPYTRTDPAGDATIARGDIRAMTVAVRPDRVQVTVRVAEGHDVSATPSWQNPASRNKLDIRIDAVGDARTDFRLIANSAGVNVWAVPGGAHVCEAEGSQPSLDRIVLWAPRSCFGDTVGVRAWAELAWDRRPFGNVDSRDRVPNSGQTPLVLLP